MWPFVVTSGSAAVAVGLPVVGCPSATLTISLHPSPFLSLLPPCDHFFLLFFFSQQTWDTPYILHQVVTEEVGLTGGIA